MKSLLLPILILAFTSASAQSVSLKKDIVNVEDQPYCKLVKTSSLSPRFSIRNLDDKELAEAKFNNDEQRYVITFLSTGRQCYRNGTMGFGKILAKEIVAANLIKDNKINPEGESRFLSNHGMARNTSGEPFVSPPVIAYQDGASNNYPTAERDRTKMVMVFGSKISQDNVAIGSWTVKTTTAEGKLLKIFTFLLPGGETIAEAWVEGVNAKTTRLIILKNNQEVQLGLKAFDETGIAKEVANYLVGRYYL